jgi:hypothetical protein
VPDAVERHITHIPCPECHLPLIAMFVEMALTASGQGRVVAVRSAVIVLAPAGELRKDHHRQVATTGIVGVQYRREGR